MHAKSRMSLRLLSAISATAQRQSQVSAIVFRAAHADQHALWEVCMIKFLTTFQRWSRCRQLPLQYYVSGEHFCASDCNMTKTIVAAKFVTVATKSIAVQAPKHCITTHDNRKFSLSKMKLCIATVLSGVLACPPIWLPLLLSSA